jgi:hypothetical protein
VAQFLQEYLAARGGQQSTTDKRRWINVGEIARLLSFFV